MRGLLSLGLILLFVAFLILKGIGIALRATMAALDGDLPRFLKALSTEEAQKVSMAAGLIRTNLEAVSSETPRFLNPSATAIKKLGYAFAWANVLWAQSPVEKREKNARRLLQAIFAEEDVDLWLMCGAMAAAQEANFLAGVNAGTRDSWSLIARGAGDA